MTHLYQINADFEAKRALVLASVDPRRQRVLRIFIHDRSAPTHPSDPASMVGEYLSFLELPTHEIAGFEPATRAEAAQIGANVAEFDLISSQPQMPRSTAEALVSAWLGKFDESAGFLVNGQLARSVPLGIGTGPGLYFKDIEAGILAVSRARAGLFWSAEDS